MYVCAFHKDLILPNTTDDKCEADEPEKRIRFGFGSLESLLWDWRKRNNRRRAVLTVWAARSEALKIEMLF